MSGQEGDVSRETSARRAAAAADVRTARRVAMLDTLLKQGAIATLAASGDALSEELAANVVSLARVAISAYLDTREKDGACAGCFLARLSLALEGEGWELGQDLKAAVHASSCKRDYEVT